MHITDIHQPQQSPNLINTQLNKSALEALLSQNFAPKISPIHVERIAKEKFIGLIELAKALNLENAVNDLIGCTEKADLRPFFDTLLSAIKHNVETKCKAIVERMIKELVELIAIRHPTIDTNYLATLLTATHKRDSESHSFGKLNLDISDTDNTDFDTNDLLHLALHNADNPQHIYSMSAPDCPVAKSVLIELFKIGDHAFLKTDVQDLFYSHPDYWHIYDSAQTYLHESNYKDPDDLLNKLVEDDDCEALYWIDDDNIEDVKEQLLPDVQTMVQMYEAHSELKNMQATYLSEWFKQQTMSIKDDAYTLLSHSTSTHIVCTHSDFIDSLSMNDGFEDGESRMELNPIHAIETLVAISINRSLFSLFDILCYVGYEKQLHPNFLDNFTFPETEQPRIFTAQP